MTSKQRAALDAMKRFVELQGGKIKDIHQVGLAYQWTDSNGVTHTMGWTP